MTTTANQVNNSFEQLPLEYFAQRNPRYHVIIPLVQEFTVADLKYLCGRDFIDHAIALPGSHWHVSMKCKLFLKIFIEELKANLKTEEDLFNKKLTK